MFTIQSKPQIFFALLHHVLSRILYYIYVGLALGSAVSSCPQSMAPTHKKSGNSNATDKNRLMLGCFGFGSKMIKKDSATPKNPEEKVVEKWGGSRLKAVHVSADGDDDHHHQALPVAKLLLINQTSLIDHESQEKKDGVGKFIKQFDHGAKDSHGVKFLRKLSLDRSKSNQMNEFNDLAKLKDQGEHIPELQKSCRKPKNPSRSSRHKLEGDAIAAMSILMVILIVMLLCGRLCAIVCASIWFYCMPRFIKTSNSNSKKNKSKVAKHENSEFDSDAYRKKVVLHGLLERQNKVYMGIS